MWKFDLQPVQSWRSIPTDMTEMWYKWKGDITSFVTPKVRCIPRQFWRHVCVCECMFGYVTELGPFFLIISATLPRLFRPRACMSVFVVCACLCLFCNLLSSPLNYRVFSRVHATLYPTVSVRRLVGWLVGWSVGNAFVFSGSFRILAPAQSHATDSAVYTALFIV